MKIHIVTIGSPKLTYAKLGWDEYLKRLQHYHSVRVTHIADRLNNAKHIESVAGKSYRVALVIDGSQFTSPGLADFLDKRSMEASEVCFLIGGPDGLPDDIINSAQITWGFSKLTFPHDLAMVILLEALYRASTINDGLPYHH
jgi:23S rRNA (pseudouridine1915-N3)-methyltransferase